VITQVRRFLASEGRAGLLIRALFGSAGLRIVGMGLGFLMGVQLARGLGPAGYGVYGIAMAIFSVFMLPTEIGLPQLIIREVAIESSAGNKQALRALMGWSFKFILMSSVVVSAVVGPFLFLGTSFVQPEVNTPLIWGLLLLPVVAIGNVASSALRGLHKIVEGQISELFLRPAVLSLLLFVTILTLGPRSLTPSHAMAMNVAAAFVGALYAGVTLARYTGFDATHPLLNQNARKWLASSIPLALGDGMRIISGQLAVLMLGAMSTTQSVGICRVAIGIHGAASLPSALLNAVCSPMFATLHQEKRPDAIQRLSSWMALFLVVSAGLSILPFALAGEKIISSVFGAEYGPANEIVLIFLFGEILAALIGHPTIILNMLKHEKVVVWSSALSLFANLILGIILVPQYGAAGAAWSVSVAQIVWRLAASYYAFRRLKLNTTIFSWFLRAQKQPTL
jgi:O-antigen/teichoic acid export membrane protein